MPEDTQTIEAQDSAVETAVEQPVAESTEGMLDSEDKIMSALDDEPQTPAKPAKTSPTPLAKSAPAVDDEYEQVDKIVIDGEDADLNSIKEWKKGYMRQSHFTQLTQQAARDREQLAADREQTRQMQMLLQNQIEQGRRNVTPAADSYSEPDNFNSAPKIPIKDPDVIAMKQELNNMKRQAMIDGTIARVNQEISKYKELSAFGNDDDMKRMVYGQVQMYNGDPIAGVRAAANILRKANNNTVKDYIGVKRAVKGQVKVQGKGGNVIKPPKQPKDMNTDELHEAVLGLFG